MTLFSQPIWLVKRILSITGIGSAVTTLVDVPENPVYSRGKFITGLAGYVPCSALHRLQPHGEVSRAQARVCNC